MPDSRGSRPRWRWLLWRRHGRSDGEAALAAAQPDDAEEEHRLQSPPSAELERTPIAVALATPARGGVGGELEAPFGRLDRILARAVARVTATYGAEVAQDPFRGLYITEREAAQWSQNPRLAPILGVVEGEPNVIDVLAGDSLLAALARAYRLTSVDVDLMLVALAPELDLHYERLFAFLQDDVSRRCASVDLALNLVCSDAAEKLAARARLSPDAPLVRHELVEVGDQANAESSFLARVLRLDRSVIRYLLGQGGVDPRLRHFGTLLEPSHAAAEALEHAHEPLAGVAAATRAADEPLVLYFSGPQSGSKRTAAHALASSLGTPLLAIDLVYALSAEEDVGQAIRIAMREATLTGAVLYLEPLDVLLTPERTAAYRRLTDELAGHRGVTVLAGSRLKPPDEGLGGVLHVPFPMPSHEERAALWSEMLATAGVTLAREELEQLAGRFRLTSDQIADAVEVASNRARLRAGAGRAIGLARVEERPSLVELFEAARGRSGMTLDGLARKIEPVHDWNGIVLPDESLAQLREICAQVVLRHRVLDEWGFGRKLSLGKGVSALFAGPSGTGKTMAADIIAGELGLDLYKIDLSGVVSKYIGETEKNLERIFSAAENANAILFFDEADALFGKRSEVRDSHDRYANIEIAYLLQRMEQYEGVAILATNLRQNMDDAFVRRLGFVVEFPFPDELQRERIWPLLFPAEAAREADIDFASFGRRFRVTGGSIKNIVLAAAFLAAGDGEPIGESHLLHATRREYVKMGRVLPEGEFEAGAIEEAP